MNWVTNEMRVFRGKIVAHGEALNERQIWTKVIPDDERHADVPFREPKRSEHQVTSGQKKRANKEGVPDYRAARSRVR